MMWWDHTISPWQGWVNICSLKTLYDRQGAFQVWYWNQSACVLRTPLEEAQLKPSHNIFWVRTYSHLSQLLSIPLPFLSLSWRTSASFHPPSSGVRPGIRSSLLHKSLGDCENTEKKNTQSELCFMQSQEFHHIFTTRHQGSLTHRNGMNTSTKTSPSFLDGSIGQGVKLASKNEHTQGSCKSLNSQEVCPSK